MRHRSRDTVFTWKQERLQVIHKYRLSRNHHRSYVLLLIVFRVSQWSGLVSLFQASSCSSGSEDPICSHRSCSTQEPSIGLVHHTRSEASSPIEPRQISFRKSHDGHGAHDGDDVPQSGHGDARDARDGPYESLLPAKNLPVHQQRHLQRFLQLQLEAHPWAVQPLAQLRKTVVLGSDIHSPPALAVPDIHRRVVVVRSLCSQDDKRFRAEDTTLEDRKGCMREGQGLLLLAMTTTFSTRHEPIIPTVVVQQTLT
jgi:hypothetical protein